MHNRLIKKALRDAAELIDKGGLAKGTSKDGDAYCAMGALNEVWPQDDFSLSLARAMSAIEEEIGVTDIPRWNDEPERTKAEVVKALRAAAKSL